MDRMAAIMKPYHKNPRQITRKQMTDLGAWLAELGDLSGIVHDLNTDEIIGGNQRARVFDINSQEIVLVDGPHEPDEQGTVAHGYISWNGKRYAYRQVRWNEKQAEKANIVANRAGGSWDFDTLANEFDAGELIEWGFEEFELGIDLTGGDDNDAEPQIDRAEELREQWGVEPGQLWRLPSRTKGQEHRLICGDCTDGAVVERVMGGELAQMIFTDPPYGVDVAGGSHDPRDKNNYRSGNTIEGDTLDDDALSQLWCDAFREAQRACIPGAAVYACFSDSRAFPSLRGFGAAGIYQSQFVIWAKQQMVFSRKDYHPQHEPIIYGWIPGAAHNAVLKRDKTTLWQIDRPMRSDKEHPTQKPIDLPQRAIGNHAAPLVYDPFLGSGTTIIAAENLSRQCRAIEISAPYVSVALQRYFDAFGIRAELVEVGGMTSEAGRFNSEPGALETVIEL